tara:strand:+ start:328 stop:873 length:546 start_codon:yes stop_codon:yes gene_type:complete
LAKKLNRRKKRFLTYQDLPLDIAIIAAGVLLLSFIYSFSKNSVHTGIPVKVTFPELNEPRKLAKDVYQTNPMKNIKIEVLNGCGIKGIASKTAEFLRNEHRIDVVKFDNADRYNYLETIIIGRNEDLDKVLTVSKAFGIPMQNKELIKHSPDESLGVDITVILGKNIISLDDLSSYFKDNQ